MIKSNYARNTSTDETAENCCKSQASKQKQDKHFLDSGSYKQGKSYFTIDRKTLDEELRKRVGTGEIKKRPDGSIREFLVFDEL